MSKRVERLILFLIDFIVVVSVFLIWQREYMPDLEKSIGNIFLFVLVVFIFWFFIFVFFGLYMSWFTRSRTDEVLTVFKALIVGVVFILIVTFDIGRSLDSSFYLSRSMIFSYLGMMFLMEGSARILFRTIHRRLLIAGIGRRRALIVGCGRKAKNLYDEVLKAPALGYDVIGFIKTKKTEPGDGYRGVPVMGDIGELHRIIKKVSVQEILIALSHRSERNLEEIIRQCNNTQVGMKIVPDLYNLIVGQVKTNQVYGFPLIELLPHLMQPWEVGVKRSTDILISLFILIGFLPLWLLFALLIKIDSKGPIFYVQDRVGKDGKIYRMIKFRSMVDGAEKMTGPVWASYNDPRVTGFGRFMRRLRLDEIPQFVNILKGDMSLVGPRPERPHFVEKFSKEIPLYKRRLIIRPGITGWAQVKGRYDQSIEHVKEKLEYDLFYLENMSLRMDLKIILITLYVMLRGDGQ